MATKKSTKTAKTKISKAPAKKPTVKKTTSKPVAKHHPHRICFGAMMMVTGFAVFLALLVGLAYSVARVQIASEAKNAAAESE